MRKVGGDKTINVLVEDNTGEARVCLWGDNTDYASDLDIGDIVEIENCHTKEGFDEKLEIQLNDEGSLKILEKRFDQNIKKLNNLSIGEEGLDIFAEVFGKSNVRDFESNGKQKRVLNLVLRDETNLVPASLWNHHVDVANDITTGDFIILENAKVKEGYSSPLEVTLPWDSRLIKNPTNESIKEKLYEEEPIKLTNLSGKETVWVKAEVVKTDSVNTFSRKDGTEGMVRPIRIMDDERTVKVSLWDKHATEDYDEGEMIFIQNAQVKESYNGVELSVGWKARVKRL